MSQGTVALLQPLARPTWTAPEDEDDGIEDRVPTAKGDHLLGRQRTGSVSPLGAATGHIAGLECSLSPLPPLPVPLLMHASASLTFALSSARRFSPAPLLFAYSVLCLFAFTALIYHLANLSSSKFHAPFGATRLLPSLQPTHHLPLFLTGSLCPTFRVSGEGGASVKVNCGWGPTGSGPPYPEIVVQVQQNSSNSAQFLHPSPRSLGPSSLASRFAPPVSGTRTVLRLWVNCQGRQTKKTELVCS